MTIASTTILMAGTVFAQTNDTTPAAGTAAPTAQGTARVRPAVTGKVTAISGSTLTVTGMDNSAYSVEALGAKVSKGFGANAQTLTVSDIKVGDTVAVFGNASGNDITATSITDGVGIGNRGAGLGLKNGAGTAANSQAALSALQGRADKEIDVRIQSLNAQLTRIGQMARLSDAQKSTLQASSQGVITDLTTLKTKIDADTDMATLKTDVQSITKSERVYMLVVPQTAILSAADRVNTVATLISGIQAKLANRVSSLPAGTNTAAMTTALSDMQTQIGNAQTAAQNASSGVAGLQPDNGVQTTMTANNAALKTARAQILAAQKDLKTAQQDAKTVLQSLKSLSQTAQPTTNTPVNQ